MSLFNPSGRCFLHILAEIGENEIILKVLTNKNFENNIDVNVIENTTRGWTPLHFAAHFSQPLTVKLLIDNGANVNALDKELHYSPLLFAIFSSNSKSAQILIENGADLNIQCNLGRNPLYLACKEGLTDVVRSLLEHGSDVHSEANNQFESRKQAIHIAAQLNHREIICLLLKHGADINAVTGSGDSPLKLNIPNSDLQTIR